MNQTRRKSRPQEPGKKEFSNDLTQDLQDQKGCQGKCDYQEAILKELKQGGKAEVGQVTQELD